MAKTWRRAIQKYGSLGAISFEKAFKDPFKSNGPQRPILMDRETQGNKMRYFRGFCVFCGGLGGAYV
jgi:hypothetical protein